jgi:hypothetical protein
VRITKETGPAALVRRQQRLVRHGLHTPAPRAAGLPAI